MNILLKLDEAALTIAPCPPELQKLLEVKEKKMDGTRNILKLFNVISMMGDHPVVMTYQGFWKMIREECAARGWTCVMEDYRKPFPAPRLDLTGGMRFSQAKLVREAVSSGMSGLIGAPTRYGKTFILMNMARAFPSAAVVITAPGKDLVRQLFSEAKTMLAPRTVRMMGGGKGSSTVATDDVMVCSMDSLHKIDKTNTDVLITDEPHAIATDTRIPQFNSFTRARRYGLGATLKGRFDNRDKYIEGLIGPVLSQVTYKEAVVEGAICPIEVVMIRVGFDPWYCSYLPQALKRVYHRNQKIASLTKMLCDNLIPETWQTMLFIKNEEHAEFMSHALSGCRWPVAMAKLLTTKARNTLTDEVKSGVHNRVICSDIYVQGMTFSDVRCLINLSGGGPYTSTIQKPGRLAEIRPEIGKIHGLLVDFMPYPTRWPSSKEMPEQTWRAMTANAESRLQAYEDIGYGIHMVENPGQLKAVMQSLTQ